MKKIAVFTGSDLRNYGGGEKDVIGWTSRLKNQIDITVYSPGGKTSSEPRVSREFIEEQMQGVHLKYYRGRKIRLLKDILPLQRFNLSEYDKVYTMCQGFLLNSMLIRRAKRILFGVHVQSTLDDRPIEDKTWKRFFFWFYRRLQIHYIRKFDEVRIQNTDDLRRLHEIRYSGKIWNVPPRMFDTTPAPSDSGTFYVVWANRIAPEKRPEELVKIAKLCPETEFRAIGSGRMAYLFDGVPNIRVTGFLSDDALRRQYQGASAYLSTSRGENFGMSAVEAMAHGVPTIVYDVMGLRDYNVHVVVDADEAAAMIRRLHALAVELPSRFASYRQSLRLETLDEFSDEVVLPRILEMVTGES